ncbi:MAG: hypothetical protein ACMV1B_01185 [Prevotella sp.]
MNPLDTLTTAESNEPLIDAIKELNYFCTTQNSKWYSIKSVDFIYLNIFDDGTFHAGSEKIESFTESLCNSFEEFVMGVTSPEYDYTYYELTPYDLKVLFSKYKDLVV